ncbi:MAG: hypothetical protein INR71_07845 [Terriglobus roseus]|nr:hypothetical protein [Terriglobus roseus]
MVSAGFGGRNIDSVTRYDETIELLYTHNVFHFRRLEGVRAFADSVPKCRLESIRSVEVDVGICHGDWRRGLYPAHAPFMQISGEPLVEVLQRMTSLRRLAVGLEHSDAFYKRDRGAFDPAEAHFLLLLSRLKVHDLEVTVTWARETRETLQREAASYPFRLTVMDRHGPPKLGRCPGCPDCPGRVGVPGGADDGIAEEDTGANA